MIIYDIDDDLLHLDPDSRFAKTAPQDYAQKVKRCILMCQAVQTSTRPLAEIISRFHPEVVMLENQLESVPQFEGKNCDNQPIVIGYAAGEDHFRDWLTIKDTYNRVISNFESCGLPLETWILGDREIFESLTVKKKRYFPLLARKQYLELMRSVDISLIPLADKSFNYSKSDIKFLESASAGAAVISSSIVYADTIRHKETGMIFGNTDEFARYLEELILNRELVATIAENAYRYVSKRRLIQQHIWKWQATYMDWFHRRKELIKNTHFAANQDVVKI